MDPRLASAHTNGVLSECPSALVHAFAYAVPSSFPHTDIARARCTADSACCWTVTVLLLRSWGKEVLLENHRSVLMD